MMAGVAATRMGLHSFDDRSRDQMGGPMDPSPDYDVSDEIEWFMRYVPWGLRGVLDGNGYPPPAYPPV